MPNHGPRIATYPTRDAAGRRVLIIIGPASDVWPMVGIALRAHQYARVAAVEEYKSRDVVRVTVTYPD